MPIEKAEGQTPTERNLASRCERSFLKFWSWPNVYKDQPTAQEVCDLLVVFDRHILVFSDKDCRFPDSGDPALDWSRWFRKTVVKAAEQAWGAERWIRAHPDRVFTDATCTRPIPLPLRITPTTVFHRIVVAHGSGPRSAREFGGSGSFMLDSHLEGDAHTSQPLSGIPFTVGNLDRARGFVHVLDDTTFGILLGTLDTIDDFTRYLEKKEQLFEGPIRVVAAGEEDLLAHYLMGMDSDGEHGFRIPAGVKRVFVDEGLWRRFETHPQRIAQVKADQPSYAWDRLIDQFAKHQLGGTARYKEGATIADVEEALRVMAAERRTQRRMLAKRLLEALEAGDKSDRFLRVAPGGKGRAAYLFLTLKHQFGRSEEAYRRVRLNLLRASCAVARVEKAADAKCLVGIATEPLGKEEDSRSEDLCFIDGPIDAHLRRNAREWSKKLRILDDPSRLKVSRYHESEYPPAPGGVRPKGRLRNLPCSCGSGKKTKKCCGARA